MKKIYFISLFTFSILILGCGNKEEIVKVKIFGYPRLKEFVIELDSESKIKIDGKKQHISRIYFDNTTRSILLADNEASFFYNEIEIESKSTVTFISHLGRQQYSGDFIIKNKIENIEIINFVSLKDYLSSVLGSEMGNGFHNEALKAQAIALRTYYYYTKNLNKKNNYDIYNYSGKDMSYRGSDYSTEKMKKIIEDTKDIILIDCNRKIGLTLFHSTSGGVILKNEVLSSKKNENIESPILCFDEYQNILLPYESPFFGFNCFISDDNLFDIIKENLPESVTGNFLEIKIKYFNNTNCVDFIGFVFYNYTYWLKGYNFISLAQKKGYMDLKSIQFKLQKEPAGYSFIGNGFGHLCGMSQYSAQKMATMGENYQNILKKYYPDLSISHRRRIYEK